MGVALFAGGFVLGTVFGLILAYVSVKTPE